MAHQHVGAGVQFVGEDGLKHLDDLREVQALGDVPANKKRSVIHPKPRHQDKNQIPAD